MGMPAVKTRELTARSSKSFRDALHKGIDKANDTVGDFTQGWVKNGKVLLEDGRLARYQVDLEVTFMVR